MEDEFCFGPGFYEEVLCLNCKHKATALIGEIRFSMRKISATELNLYYKEYEIERTLYVPRNFIVFDREEKCTLCKKVSWRPEKFDEARMGLTRRVSERNPGWAGP